MLAKNRGFTIIEICVVIVTLGILLTIGLVSWTSYVSWSEDRSREASVQQWASTFDLYKSRFFAYPVMPTNAATPAVTCLGAVNSFPTAAGANTGGNRCGQFKTTLSATSASTSSDMTDKIARVSNIPKNPHEESARIIYENTLIGPLVHVSRSADTGAVTVTARYVTFMKGNCDTSKGFEEATTANISTKLPGIASLKLSTGPGSSAKVCFIEKSFQQILP